MSTRGFDGKPPWVNPDSPKQQAEVAVGLKNLFAWMGVCPRGYTGPWPSAYRLQDDAAYALFLGREDIAAALRVPAPVTRAPRPKQSDEPPVPAAAPDGPVYEEEYA
jgi:hypothetical protein